MTATAEGERAPAKAAIGRDAIVALTLLSLINLLNYFDRSIITVVAEPIKKEFGLTDTQLGFISGPAFIGVYMVMTMVFGRLIDHRSRKGVLTFILVVWSAMTAFAGFATSHLMLILARAGVGFGEGGSSATSMSVIADSFPTARRSTASAIWNAVGLVGILAAFLGGGWVAEHHGWRAAFFMAGIPGLILAPIVWFCMKEPTRGAHDKGGHVPIPLKAALGQLWANRPYRWLVLAIGLATFGNLGMMQWLPLFFIRSHHMALTDVGLFFGPAVVSGLIIGTLIGGRLGDILARKSIGHTLLIPVCSNLAMMPAYWVVLWLPSLPGALAMTFVAALISCTHTAAASATVQTVTPPGARGLGVAIFSFFIGLIAQGVAPFLVGVLSDAFHPKWGIESLRVALSVMIVLPGVAGLLFIRVRALTIRDFPDR